MLLFCGPAASRRWQKRRALQVMQTLTAEASPQMPHQSKKGEVVPAGCQGLDGFPLMGLRVSERSQAAVPHQSSYPWEATCLLVSWVFLRSPWYHQPMAVLQVAGRGHFCCRGLMPSGLCPGAEGAQASCWDFRCLGITRPGH